MNWLLALLTPLRRTNHMLFMRDSLDAMIEPVLMKWAASMNGQK